MSLTKATYSMIVGAPANVLDYGADPTGVSDSTAAIQSAIDAAATVYIPAGTYLISSSLTLHGNLTIQGESKNATIIKASSGFTTDSYLDSMMQDPTSSSILPRVFLRDFTLDGQGAATFFAALKFDRVYDSWFENVYIRQSQGHGMYLRAPVNGGMQNIYVNAPVGNAVWIVADSGTGQWHLGALLCDNGGNVPAVYVTQTSQNKFTLLADSIRVEGGYSCVASINSYTISTDNAIYFGCGSIRAETAPHASAVSPSVFYNYGRTMYQIGEVRLGGSASGWTNIVEDVQRSITKTTSPVIGLNVGNLQLGGQTIQLDLTATPNLGGRVGFGEAPVSGMIDVYAGNYGTGASIEPAQRATQRSATFTGSVIKWIADRASSWSAFRFLELYANGSSGTLVYAIRGDGAMTVGAGGALWLSGSGSPEGVVTAVVGSLYTRTDGGASTTLYVKESGTGNTGWVAK